MKLILLCAARAVGTHIPLHNQVVPWAMKKHVDVVHRADNRMVWRDIKVN